MSWSELPELMKLRLANRVMRWAFAVTFWFGGVVHALALIWPQISIPEPVAEHVVFIFVNIGMGVVLLLRKFPRFVLTGLLGVLLGQQVMRHLPLLIESFSGPKFDFQSFTALLSIIFITVGVLIEPRAVWDAERYDVERAQLTAVLMHDATRKDVR